MKISELPVGVHKKLWDIQRAVKPIAMRSSDSDEDDGSRYTPAPDVFAEVRRQLARHHVMVVPTDSSTQVANDGKRIVTLGLELKDLETGQTMPGGATGESDDAAGAQTNALKNFYLATFLIPTVDPAEDRNEQRRRKVAAAPPVTSSQIRNFIEPAVEEAGISEEELSALLLDRFGVDALVKLPRASADDLVKALRANGTAAPA